MLLPDSGGDLAQLIVEAKHFGLKELERLAQTKLQEAQRGGIPAGMIAQWAGRVDSIPEGWALCDGQNDTPDLRDKFIVAAGQKFPVGATKDQGQQLGANHTRGRGSLLVPEKQRHGHKIQQRDWLTINFGEPVPAHFALAFIMRQ